MRGFESAAEVVFRLAYGGEIKARPVEYGGRQMRSKLEADFARYLDRLGETWVYEPAIYGPVGEGYKPDFQMTSSRLPCFIEVKPTVRHAIPAMKRMPIIWETHPDAILLIAVAEESRFYELFPDGGFRFWRERWAHS